jgi:hypothetical protein
LASVVVEISDGLIGHQQPMLELEVAAFAAGAPEESRPSLPDLL